MKLKILIPVSILLFALSFLILGHIYVSKTTANEIEYATDALLREVILRSSLIETELNKGETNAAKSHLKGFTTDPDIIAARIIDETNIVTLSTIPAEEGEDVGNLDIRTDIDAHVQRLLSSNSRKIEYDRHHNILEMVYPLTISLSKHSLRPDTQGIIVVQKDLSRILAISQEKENRFALMTSTMLAFLSLLLWFLMDRQIAKPITDIRAITKRIASGDLEARINTTSYNEIGILASDINRMAESLQNAQQQLSNNLRRLEVSQKYGAIGTWDWNIQSGDLHWSDEVYRLFGVDKESFTPTFEAYLQLIHPNDRENIKQSISNSLQNHIEYEVRHRIVIDDELHWLLGRGDTERDETGEPIRMMGTVQDVTRQIRHEDELVEAYNEVNYQVNTLNQHAMVCITDAQGVITYVNKNLTETSGYSATELVGSTHRIMKSDYHPPVFWSRFWNTISAGEIWTGEIRNRRKDGSDFWVLTTVAPHIGANGKPDRYTCIYTDVTALKLAQDELRREHQQIQAVADINNAYIHHKNRNEIFDSILKTYLDLTGSDFGFIGRVSYNVDTNQNTMHVLAMSDISWDDNSRALFEQQQITGLEFGRTDSLYGHVLATDSPYISNNAMQSEYYGGFPKGHPPIDNFLCMPLHYGNEFIGMIGLANHDGGYDEDHFELLQRANDTAARVIHEHRLQQHNVRLLRAVNTSSSEVFIFNPLTFRILDANPAACKNLGYSLNEIKKLSITDIARLDNTLVKQLKGLTEADAELVAESIQIRRDGSAYPVEARIQLITDETPHVIVAITQDISDRKFAEQRVQSIQKQLFQSQKMEALGHLTGGIAHDFNNMLASILGFSELSYEQLQSGKADVGKLQGYLEQVITASKRARDLITQMLTFSRTKSDSQDSVSLVKPIISEVATMLSSSLPSTIELNYSVEGNLPAARIKPVQLHQILMNLSINARDAMEGQGNIHIDAKHEHISDVCNGCHKRFKGDYVCIQVRDNGSGIEPQALEHIFEPFFTTKEAGKGTGMGLSVVHGIVHSHDGHITVSSHVGEGTTFSIYLKSSEHDGDEYIEESGDELGSSLSEMRAVIIDDDISVGQFLQEMLRMYDIDLKYFNDSRKALEYLREHHGEYDVLISDMTMPNLTGLQLAEELTQIDSGLPVILCSGYNSEDISREKCEELGIVACMSKPVDTRELLRIIADLGVRRH